MITAKNQLINLKTKTIVVSIMAHVLVIQYKIDTSVHKTKKLSRQVITLKSKVKNKQIIKTEVLEKNNLKNKASFLSSVSQSVLRETTARKTGVTSSARKGSRSANSKTRQNKFLKKLSFSKKSFYKKILIPKKVAKQIKGIKSGKKHSRSLASSSDFTKDIKLGDLSIFNTKEYKYFGFYDRIRKQLEKHWTTELNKKVKAIWKSGRKIAMSENNKTNLIININNNGKIVSIKIKGSSGISELDDAAVNSFNKAGPFPNPPKEMLSNGIAQIKWGFVVKG